MEYFDSPCYKEEEKSLLKLCNKIVQIAVNGKRRDSIFNRYCECKNILGTDIYEIDINGILMIVTSYDEYVYIYRQKLIPDCCTSYKLTNASSIFNKGKNYIKECLTYGVSETLLELKKPKSSEVFLLYTESEIKEFLRPYINGMVEKMLKALKTSQCSVLSFEPNEYRFKDQKQLSFSMPNIAALKDYRLMVRTAKISNIKNIIPVEFVDNVISTYSYNTMYNNWGYITSYLKVYNDHDHYKIDLCMINNNDASEIATTIWEKDLKQNEFTALKDTAYLCYLSKIVERVAEELYCEAINYQYKHVDFCNDEPKKRV